MDISIAVVHLTNSSFFSLKSFCSPDQFEILLVQSEQDGNMVQSLLRRRLKSQTDVAGEALKAVRELYGANSCRRAVPVPIHLDQLAVDAPSTSSSITTASSVSVSFSTLYCVPVLDYDLKGSVLPNGYRFVSLPSVLNDSLNLSSLVDVATRHFVERIDSWLSSQQQKSVEFLSRLFTLKTLKSRFRQCVHNPAAGPAYENSCFINIVASTASAPSPPEKPGGSDLEEAVKKSNAIRVRMMGMDKYDAYFLNPSFNASHPSGRITDYYAKGRQFERCLKIEDQMSPTELWETQYPLHKAAYDDDRARTQALLDQGQDPNLLDNDSWTPLHYCAFYGRLEVAEVLMHHSGTDVNLRNKKGETPLHFAALNGYYHLIELILSNAKIDIEITNNRGLTPLDLCKNNPRNEWEHCAILLRSRKPQKMEVRFGEKGTMHMSCNEKTTAGALRDRAFRELGLGSDCHKIFAVWIVGPRLSLQLQEGQSVLTQLNKYNDYLEILGEPLAPTRPGVQVDDSSPAVYFKRNARAMVRQEEDLSSSCPKVYELLFDEAMNNFLKGLCPCNENDLVLFGSIIAIIRFGDEPLRENMLGQVFPAHAIPSSKRKKANLLDKLNAKIKETTPKDTFLLQVHFMRNCWTMRWYGCTFFKATLHMSKPDRLTMPALVGINDYGLLIIDASSHELKYIMKHKELNPEPKKRGSDSLDFDFCKSAYVFSLNTPQAKLIENLLTIWRDMHKKHEQRKAMVKAASKAPASPKSDQKPARQEKSTFRKLMARVA